MKAGIFGKTREEMREWMKKFDDVPEPAGCPACGLIAGCCSLYPNCPGNPDFSTAAQPQEMTMGNWVLYIEGTGQHHNTQHPKDADVLAQAVVNTLREAGQNVTHAVFTYGGNASVLGRSPEPKQPPRDPSQREYA
jgi:hypothetical protein